LLQNIKKKKNESEKEQDHEEHRKLLQLNSLMLAEENEVKRQMTAITENLEHEHQENSLLRRTSTTALNKDFEHDPEGKRASGSKEL
jgi:hypothetical protein